MRYYICPNGDFSTVDGHFHFCVKCGSKLISSCPLCGRDIKSAEAKFCHNCGAPLFPEKKSELRIS